MSVGERAGGVRQEAARQVIEATGAAGSAAARSAAGVYCYSPSMKKSTEQERAYFFRVGRANATQGESRPPASLMESFERFAVLELLHEEMGGTLESNQGSTDGDLASHGAYLTRLRTRPVNARIPSLVRSDDNELT